MENFITIAILSVIFIFALHSTIKHFSGKSSCCGGGTYKARKKNLNNIIVKKEFKVEGMNCQNCVNKVMEAINSMDGISCIVHLKKGIVVVSATFPVKDEIIINAIENAGYTVKR